LTLAPNFGIEVEDKKLQWNGDPMRIALSKQGGLPAVALIIALTACGGGQRQTATDTNSVAIEGSKVSVSWDRATAKEATAVGVITSDEPVLIAAQAIERITGCAAKADEATLGDSIFIRSDGQLQLTLGIDCTQVASVAQTTPSRDSAATTSDSSRMAAAVEAAIRQVVSQPSRPVSAQPAVARSVSGQAQLFEGSPYAAFSATDIQLYCGQDWTTRVAENGRTEYNPCTQRCAFR